MQGNFLHTFIKALDREDLNIKARAQLNRLPLAPSVIKKINELEAQMETFQNPEEFRSIESEMLNWCEYGNRVTFVTSADGNEELVEIKADKILNESYFKDVSEIIGKLDNDFKAFIDNVTFSGLSRSKRIKELQSQLDGFNGAMLKLARSPIGKGVDLMILGSLQSKILSLIQELNRFGVHEKPRYDYEKLKEYVHNRFYAKPQEDPAIFQGVQNNWKGERHYLFNGHEEKNFAEEVFSPEPIQSDFDNRSITKQDPTAIEKIVDMLVSNGTLHEKSRTTLIDYLEDKVDKSAPSGSVHWLGTANSFTQFISALFQTGQYRQQGNIPWKKWHNAIRFPGGKTTKNDSMKKLYQEAKKKPHSNPFIDKVNQAISL